MVAIKSYIEFLRRKAMEIASKDRLKLGEINIIDEILEGFESSLSTAENDRVRNDAETFKRYLDQNNLKFDEKFFFPA